MKNVLDHVADSEKGLTVKTIGQLFALQIARRLNDLSELTRYLVLFEHYEVAPLLRCYRQAVMHGKSGSDFFAAFQQLTNQTE